MRFCENIAIIVFIKCFICISLLSAQNNSHISGGDQTLVVVLNDDNTSTVLQTPGFPTKHYPKNYRVNYDIKVNLSERIQQLSSRLRIKLEYIAIEPSDHCNESNLQIIFPMGEIRVFCGLHAGKTMISDSGTARVEFKGNDLEQDRGFKIVADIIRSNCSQKFVNKTDVTIESPNYPNNYDEETTCVWEIEVPNGKFIKLTFDGPIDINVPNSNICAEDYLLVSQSGDFDVDVQRFCGNQNPSPIISTSNKMLIKFNSNSANTAKGFRAKFVEHDRPESAPARLPMLTPEGCPCGKENLRFKRIVGGSEVNPAHRYPWMVSIGSSRGSPFCGGALINNLYVLTAAHCVVDENPESIGVRIGQHSLQEPTPILKISAIKLHDDYDSVSQKNDIAVLRLQNPIQYNENIEPVCIPPSDLDDPDGLWVSGWGRTDEGGRTSDRLNEVTLPQYSLAKCENKYAGLVSDKQLCAGGIKGQDACQGDSGGPLQSKINGKVNIVGIISWGIGCARENYPGVYTRVSAYLKWIEDKTRDGTYCLADNSTSNLIDQPIQPNFESCGIPNHKLSKRVVGGTETIPQEFPWIVVIAVNNQIMGSGSLIAANVVLTSAHKLKEIYDKNRNPDIKVIVGAHDVTKSEPNKRVYRVNQIIFHPKFGQNAPLDNDFAILELKSTAEGFLPQNRPVCLPRSDTPYKVGASIIGAGWGRTSTNSAGSRVLRKVELHLSSRSQCSRIYKYLTDSMICAQEDKKDMCTGDEGAPLMQYFEGRMYLFGVYSYQSSSGCVSGNPSIFGDVRYTLEWIRDVTNNAIKTA
ncbi:ovochymase-2-like [Oppia nitens]|uniref:ovochymase-2-like n=1 Tax=Oppia nitens TaxID=1686743 RepID=UPI0023D9EA46|nr:ovochymase-2-like [Oppia nitens]